MRTMHLLTAQTMKFAFKNFFRKCDQIRSFLRIWSHLLKKFQMENFIFCAVRLILRIKHEKLLFRGNGKSS